MYYKDLIPKKMLKVEIADSPSKHQKGLMFRTSMPFDNGMLFIFSNNDYLKFWGVNTFIPLDIAFVKEGKIFQIDKISPMSYKSVSSNEKCKIAIEANDGFFKRNKINIGDSVDIENKDDDICIYFK